MHKTAVIYWSRTGNTEAMAKAIERGLRAGGSQTALLRVTETDTSVAEEYDRFALGCPAMGKEALEESRFDPFFTAIEKKLRGKRVALFGTYGWGDGKWMRDWQTRVIATGARLFEQGLIFQVENPLVARIKRIFGREKKPGETACFAFGLRFATDETEKGES